MGSLDYGSPTLKRLRFGARPDEIPFWLRQRSRFSRFFLFKKLDYLQWIGTVVVFLFLLVSLLFFLPGSVDEKPLGVFKNDDEFGSGDLSFLEEYGILDFGEDVRFEPSKVLEKFTGEFREFNMLSQALNRTRLRYPHRKAQLALVFGDLLVDSQQLMMVTVVFALQEIGYEIQVYTLEGGPMHNVWTEVGVPVRIVKSCDQAEVTVDWLNFDGVLVNSIEAKGLFSCFVQEPFNSVPLVWTIHDRALAYRLSTYSDNKQTELLNDWKRAFDRSNVVIFPNHIMPIIYSTYDAGNFFVIPGSPAEAWKSHVSKDLESERDKVRRAMGYDRLDMVITVVGSEFLYRGMWLEHSIVLRALLPIHEEFSSDIDLHSNLKIVVMSGYSMSNYSLAIEAIAHNLEYPSGVVKHVVMDTEVDRVIIASDVVLYGSLVEEKSFPDILIKAMSMEIPIIAPDLDMIKKYVVDGVNGYVFPKGNVKALSKVLMLVISKENLTPIAHAVALRGGITATNIMVSECVKGYSLLLENILRLPSEVSLPKNVSGIPPYLKEKWQWHLLDSVSDMDDVNTALRGHSFLDRYEEKWNRTQHEKLALATSSNESFSYSIWQEEKYTQIANARKRREEEEIKDRTEQHHGSWEDVYRAAKKIDRSKNDLRERDEGELERTGQPLCIYEPYVGEGAWPFLHRTSLYRGISLSSKGRRYGTDDIDAASRLSLLSNIYNREILGEYGAFFAIAHRIDRIHRNAWIGFGSWRAVARNASLSTLSERALLHAIQTKKHGDALYFWVRMDSDSRNPLLLDFWSFCDAINAGNCKFAFSEAMKKMYGVKGDFESLPPMPQDGDTWSVTNSWALPTRSFLEFVMFSRMFVNALDSQMYKEHHSSGHCYLSLSKDKHCYSRLLEVLVNVWAYHSARRMVYLNPVTGAMREQHGFKSRRGHMWIKWFSYATLKSMDEDLAEEADVDRPTGRRWLWPSTGEVLYPGILEKEKSLKQQQKEKRKQKNKEKVNRMRRRSRQKVLGKYIKPPPEGEEENTNRTATAPASSNTTMLIGNS